MASPDLGPYAVRISDRARHARLQISSRGELLVVVPRRFVPERIPALLEQHRRWIERTRDRLGASALPDALTPPELLELRAIGEQVDVAYRTRPGPASARVERGTVVVAAEAGDSEGTRSALRRWLARRARETLAPRCFGLAAGRWPEPARVVIRQQRTRWGSCAPSGTVSLNATLLFLPPPLVDYVIAHELCHLIELNHSPRFWRILEEVEPASARLRVEMRKAGRYVPAFLA